MKESVFVVGGGTSLLGFDFNKLKNKDTITVNKSVFDVPNPTHFITMDYTFLNKIDRSKLKELKVKKHFVVNLEPPYMEIIEGKVTDIRTMMKYDLSMFDVQHISNKSIGFSVEKNDFRSGLNSGHCAVQLAIKLGYKKIYLLGLDYKTSSTSTHYHGGYSDTIEKFNAKCIVYRENFFHGINELRKSDIELISLSPVSELNFSIKYQDINEVL